MGVPIAEFRKSLGTEEDIKISPHVGYANFYAK